MPNIALLLNWIVFSVLVLGNVSFLLTSAIEKRWRATGLSFVSVILLLGAACLILFQPFEIPHGIVLFLPIGIIILTIMFILPIRKNLSIKVPGAPCRLDEREAIFHRFYRLRPGMKEFNTFYKMHPKLQAIDDKIRNMPNLDEPGSRSYDPLTSMMNAATFDVIEKITRDVEWLTRKTQVKVTDEEITSKIKGFGQYLGADLIGITKLNPAHVYSHIGRSPGKWGDPIELNHPFAIAIGVEMDFDMVHFAPHHASTTETAYKYFEAAKVAMILSRYIQLLGYEARAHVDGNYRVMCVPVAADAGLGELGRLGLLITPEFGPRVRLSVVTTNLPLVCDKPIAFGVQDFCTFCKKCARNCPSAAIDNGDKKIYNGVEKWQSSQESCYKFWRLQGSDCSLCLQVCPYSHPSSLTHNLVRWVIKQNHLARRLALLADDFFYGKRPKSGKTFPSWHQPSQLNDIDKFSEMTRTENSSS